MPARSTCQTIRGLTLTSRKSGRETGRWGSNPPVAAVAQGRSCHHSSPRPASLEKSRRMPEGLHRLVSARSRVRVPPGPTCGPVAQLDRAGRLSNPSSPRNETAGECRREYIGKGFGPGGSTPQLSSFPRRRYRTRANADRTTWGERPREREVGGSNPPPGNRVAQQRMVWSDLVARTVAAANAGEDYMGLR
jgi:hypothetical protein